MLLIDTYNVLHQTGILPPDLAGPSLIEFVRLVRSSRFADRPLTFVCDGPQPPPDEAWAALAAGTRLPPRLVFSGVEKEADDIIEHLVRRHTAPRRLTVVSSDRRLVRVAEVRRCRHLYSEQFLGMLADDFRARHVRRTRAIQAYEVPLDAGSVRYWMRMLGIEPEAPEGSIPISEDECERRLRELAARADEAVQRTPAAEESAPKDVAAAEPDAAWWARYFGVDPAEFPEVSGEARRPGVSSADAHRAESEEPADDGTIDVDDLDMGRFLGES